MFCLCQHLTWGIKIKRSFISNTLHVNSKELFAETLNKRSQGSSADDACYYQTNSLQADTFLFLYSRSCLSLAPNIIYAAGEQENMNNVAVFPQLSMLRQADSCQPIAQETFICMSNLEGKKRKESKGI